MDLVNVYKALKTPPLTGWNRGLIWRGALSGFVGMVLGMVTSMVVNVALVEISVSPFFALYFGVIFILTGGVIAWRVSGTPLVDEDARRRQKVFFVLSCLVSIAGVVCCFIQRQWFYGMPKIIKVPTYTLLGMAIAFALIFSAIDLMNVAFGLCAMNTSSRSPIDSAVQVSLIVGVTLLQGIIFGFVFGILDVSNEINYHVKMSLMRDEQYCYPIGGALGLLAGFANEYIRHQEEGYIQIKRSEYETDI